MVWIWFVAFLVMVVLYVKDALLKDSGSAICVCPSRKLQLTMVRLCERNGIKAKFRVDSPARIYRAFMSNGWIFNYVPDKQLLERMGNPVAAFAFVVKDPMERAYEDFVYLKDAGYQEVEILKDIDPGVPAGKLVGIRFKEGENRFCIIYRYHFLKMGEKVGQQPPAWDWDNIPALVDDDKHSLTD